MGNQFICLNTVAPMLDLFPSWKVAVSDLNSVLNLGIMWNMHNQSEAGPRH